ncbi:hypothetical protein BDV96DRAFT_353376 [Lophiotrema nucula]|uniref:Uncharacterized protein n=1 Tax=Lophiotrema nucula TaxID=690887 RepID=A0A6A5ZKW3_9PLEO|nr:hypothetical protein BDV96DRAFT_353376 [Lophiotrema nucula]
MRSSIVLATVLPAAFTYAIPAVVPWTSAKDNKVACNATETGYISFVTPGGPSNGTQLAVDSCKALDPCLYPEDLHPTGSPDDIVCPMTLDRSLNKAKSGSMHITALYGGNKRSKNITIDLFPPANPTGQETYRKADCEGYLSQLFSLQKDKGGCADKTQDAHMGQLTVGTGSTLSGAVFKASLIDSAT